MRIASVFQSIAVFIGVAALTSATAFADPPALKTQLPDEKPYQQELRKYLGSLVEKDFDPGVKDPPKAVSLDNPDEAYRFWVLNKEFPHVGTIQHGERQAPGVNVPSSVFLLSSIEDPKLGVSRPCLYPEPIAWLANWKYPGNPYYGSRPLKLRAFVTATIDMLMFDDQQAHSTARMYHRSDWFGPHLVMYAYTYPRVRDAITPEARAAFEACLKGMMQRVSAWGPTGDEGYLDMYVLLGVKLTANALNDPEVSKLAEAYAHKFFDNPWYYNPAGYFPDQGCYDAGFNGLSLYWGTWLALASPDWPFAQEAVKKAWRLRGTLMLPEPDGQFVGPSHASSRTGSDVVKDQWDWASRALAASFLTDDAACQTQFPTPQEIADAPASFISALASQVAEYPTNPHMARNTPVVWRWMLYPDTPLYPTVNYAYEFCPKGYLAHREELTRKNSPLLKVPFQRDASFVEAFAKVFLIAKKPSFGVVIHTGPVSAFKGGDHVEFTGPYGLSGGSLSAFWTPATGSVILGRRGGMQFPNNKNPNFDLPEAWRTWPVHAVTGMTAAGKFFTSARNQTPEATYDVSNDKSTVKVTGVIPAVTMGTEKALDGKVDYARLFTLDDKGLSVETTVTGDGKDSIAELYEVLPVFLREVALQPKATPTTIEFESAGKWAAATDQYVTGVTAVRLTRFNGAVVIRFDRPRRVKLSPADWNDTFLSKAACRNVLVDLLENDDKPAMLKDAKKVSYRIEPAAK